MQDGDSDERHDDRSNRKRCPEAGNSKVWHIGRRF